jgi:hypothetical protein
MENSIITLVNILKDQCKTQYDLFDAEQKKTDILVKGDVEKLNELMITEQALLMLNIFRLETKYCIHLNLYIHLQTSLLTLYMVAYMTQIHCLSF